MGWFLLFLVVIALISKLDDIIELFKSRSPNYQEEQDKRQKNLKSERALLIAQLYDLEGGECQVTSTDLLYMFVGSTEITGSLCAVDNDWIELEVMRKRKKMRVFLRVDNIQSVSRILQY